MSTKNQIALRNLAIEFRLNSPNLFHCTVFDAIYNIGGHVCFLYGVLSAINRKRERKRSFILRNEIARLLDIEAKKLD